MKVTGQGLHLSPTQFTVSIPPEPAKLISYTKAGDINPDKWSMSDIRTPDVAKDYCACLSCYGKILKINYFLHI